ncbi:MAG: adenylyltransferase/cytidyltransferase family protein [Patescibacteria group bacterium]|nr:adenylyltransferase/cytidyltransferase family protein [Patescibacteria group bacterium]
MVYRKIQSRSTLFKVLKDFKKKGKKIVFARGCFDLFHPGHLYYLKKAKALGDILVVWVNTDQSVRELKGKNRPLFSEQERMDFLANLEVVDFVSSFSHQEGLDIIQRFKPEIVVLNRVSLEYQRAIQAYKGKIAIISLFKKYSTTKIINQISKTLWLKNQRSHHKK